MRTGIAAYPRAPGVIVSVAGDRTVDLELPGPIPFVFERFYSSARHGDRHAKLGPGWAHNLEQFIRPRETKVLLREGEGRWIGFAPIPVGGETFHLRERLRLTRPREDEYHVYSLDTRHTRIFHTLVQDGLGQDELDRKLPLRAIADAWQNRISFEYAGARLDSVTDTAGRVVRLSWQERRIASIRVEGGPSVHYEHDADGFLREARDVLGNRIRYQYDERGRMVARTIKTGETFTYKYDADGRCILSQGAKGEWFTELTYDRHRQETTIRSVEPRVYRWNELGLADRETLPDGTLLEEVAYTPDGHLAVKVDGSGLGHRFVRDEYANVVEIVNQSGAVRKFAYQDDLLTQVTDYDGLVTRYAYDDKGALRDVVYPNGATYSFTHDDRGRLTRVVGPQGEIATYEYDLRHNLVRETDPKGEATTYTYNAVGLPLSATDPLGRTTRVTYDALGRRVQVDLPDRTSRKFVYDGESRLLSSTNGNGETTWMLYKGINALQEVNLANGQAYRFRYNANEKLLQVTNLLGDTHKYTRDQAGRVVKEETFDGRELGYRYTPGGQVEQITYPDGSTRRFEYSWTRFLLREFTHDTESEFLRDGVGRLTQARITSRNETHVTTFERDEFGRVTAEVQQGRRIQYERDVQGRVVKRTLPNGATTSYEFATDGALDRLDHDGYRLELKRDKVGREVQRAGSGGARIVSAYDELDRLAIRAAGPLGEKTPTARRKYTYDKAGRVKEIHDDRWGHAMYFCDPAGRLLESRQFRLMETFLHDPASSIVEYVTQSNDGDVAAIAVFTRPQQKANGEYGKGGRLLKKREWSYEYDRRGRRTAKVRTLGDARERTEYEWDGRDKLRTIRKPDGTRLDYSYDVFGRRVSKTRSGGALEGKRVEFVWDGEVLAFELDSETGPRAFVHEPGGFEPVLQQQGGETYLCVNDHLGMPKELIDGGGRLAWAAGHSAYGKVIATQGPGELEVEGGFVSGGEPRVESPFRLLGQVNDPDAELTWTRFRCFDADTGTWISTDPLEFDGGLNLYAFDGSPSDVVDPLGLSTSGGACPGQRTTAIGRMADLKKYDKDDSVDTWHKSGRMPSRDGGGQVTWPENRRWLQERIDRGDRFVVATDPATLPPPTPAGLKPGQPNGYFTALELAHLRRNGIEPDADY